MAAKTPARSVHATLSGTTADSITWTGGGPYGTVNVQNRDGTNVLYVRFDGTTAVAAADGTYAVAVNSTRTFNLQGTAPYPGVLSVVGNGGGYSVEGV
jgi:hypothetical protein